MLYTQPPALEVYEGDPVTGPFKAIVAPVFQDEEGKPSPKGVVLELEKKTGLLEASVRTGDFKGEPGEFVKGYLEGKILIFAGVGKESDPEDKRLENVRRGFATGVKQVVEKVDSALLLVGGLGDVEAYEASISSMLSSYRLEEFQKDKKRRLERLYVDSSKVPVEEIRVISEGVYLARDIANAPPNHLSPPKLAEALKKVFQGLPNTKLRVLSFEDLVREGFGGIVNVGKGSDEKPRLIIIEYWGREGKPVALAGKTVVFDTGGINLKPSQGMTLMRADKAGGAAVVGAIYSAAKLGLKASLVGLLPAVINAPGGSSYLPSDVIRMWDGTMVEITNTDAEGRLILADVIALAARKYDATEIIDLATLTGAIVVALGPLVAGLFTSDERLKNSLLKSSARTGEKIYPMPMVEEYKASLTKPAQVGDIVNAAQRYGGAIFGALFLERFSHGKPFAHIDIAGPGIAFEAGYLTPPYWPERNLAPGFGVRLIVDYLKSKEVS